jgi:hypothetical protein
MTQQPVIPPYAGIAEPKRIGLAVDECANRAGRFGFFSQQLMRIQAAKMSSIESWELKAMLGRQLWECALHWGWWRERIRELRGHEHLINRHTDDKLGDFFNEILWSRSDVEFAVALFSVALPAYHAALKRYVEQTNQLVDQPTVRLIRHVLLDLEAHIAFGQHVLDALENEHPSSVWRAHVQAYLNAAGGVDGTTATSPSYTLPPTRSEGEWRIPQDFARDARFQTTIPKTNPYDEVEVIDALHSKMWVRSQEMTAAELCATVLYEWDDLPYEGCVDLARHCWDEVRHSLFGQAALESEGIQLESLPNWVGYAGHTMPFAPQQRYSHLAIATEANAMGYPGGKRGEWEWCRDKAQHPLMTTFQDFDWADEVNHVGFGRKWLIQYFLNGDRNKAQAMADETSRERMAFYQAYEHRNNDANRGASIVHEPGKDGY